MSAPPVNTSQHSKTPSISTSNTAKEGQTSDSTEQSNSMPPLVIPNFITSPPPDWMTEWKTPVPTPVPVNSSSPADGFESNSSSMRLISRGTTSSTETEPCLESLPPEVLWNIFSRLQEPRLMNTVSVMSQRRQN